MPVYLDSWKMYFYLDSVWTDVTEDVLHGITVKWGMKSNYHTDRLAETGSLSFSLDNSTGKYSPDGISALSGWKKGVAVKLVLTHNSIDYIKFRGLVDKITIDPFTNRDRRVGVSVLDWFDHAAKYPLNAPSIQLDKRANEALDYIIDAMPIQPIEKSINVGTNRFKTIFSTSTTRTIAYSEFEKLVLSEWGYLYLRKPRTTGEKLVFENSAARPPGMGVTEYIGSETVADYLELTTSEYLELQDDDYILLAETETFEPIIGTTIYPIAMDVTYGDHLINRISVSAYPKKIETTSKLLYELEEPIWIGDGQTIRFRVQYTDPQTKKPISALQPDDNGETKSLLHLDGNHFGRLFTDETGKVWTSRGGVENVTNVKKFGTASGYWDGSEAYLDTPTSPDFDFGGGDFTVDWWEYRFNAKSGAAVTSRNYAATYPPFLIGRSNGKSSFVYLSSNGTSWDIANAKTLGTIPIAVWTHYALVRSGNNFYTFKNGVQQTTWTSALALYTISAPMSIGRNRSTYITACIDDFRVTKGLARWTANFTPPTEAANISGTYFTAWTNKNQTGTELTGDFDVIGGYGGAGADITITNNSGQDGYLTTLKIHSYGIVSDTPITDIQEDAASYNEYGYHTESIDMLYQTDTEFGNARAAEILDAEKQPRTVLNKVTINANRDNKHMLTFLNSDIGDIVAVEEAQTGISAKYFIQGMEFEIIAADIINYSWIVKEYEAL